VAASLPHQDDTVVPANAGTHTARSLD